MQYFFKHGVSEFRLGVRALEFGIKILIGQGSIAIDLYYYKMSTGINFE